MTNALIAETIKDMSEQGCDQSFRGFNSLLVRLVTDAAYFVLKGMKTMHQNLRHMHADMDEQNTKLITVTGKVDDFDADLDSHNQSLTGHDGSLSSYDDDIKVLLLLDYW